MRKEQDRNEQLDKYVSHQVAHSVVNQQTRSFQTELTTLLKNSVFAKTTEEERTLVEILEKARPESLRAFDQIPMRGMDLLFQVKLVAARLANKNVVFMGDHDGTSLLLGLLSSQGFVRPPARMTLLDFDERLLATAQTLAKEYNFDSLLETRPYNVFHPEPSDLRATFDAFYTNPPYGKSNLGESARLFIARACNFTKPDQATGYILLPNDQERRWTRESMYLTQRFLIDYGWNISTQLPALHRYYLDDDKTLMSSLLIADRIFDGASYMPWTGRQVGHKEITNFYGQSVLPPYPLFISEDGREIYQTDTLP